MSFTVSRTLSRSLAFANTDLGGGRREFIRRFNPQMLQMDTDGNGRGVNGEWRVGVKNSARSWNTLETLPRHSGATAGNALSAGLRTSPGETRVAADGARILKLFVNRLPSNCNHQLQDARPRSVFSPLPIPPFVFIRVDSRLPFAWSGFHGVQFADNCRSIFFLWFFPCVSRGWFLSSRRSNLLWLL